MHFDLTASRSELNGVGQYVPEKLLKARRIAVQRGPVGIPGDADDLFYDAKRKRLYATCGEGFVAVIRRGESDHYELTEKVPTAKLARTGFFDPDGGLLYVVVPRLEGQDGPLLRVYRAKP